MCWDQHTASPPEPAGAPELPQATGAIPNIISRMGRRNAKRAVPPATATILRQPPDETSSSVQENQRPPHGSVIAPVQHAPMWSIVARIGPNEPRFARTD